MAILTPSVLITVQDHTSPGTFTPTQLFNTVWSLWYQAEFHYNYSPWVERGYSQPAQSVRLIEPNTTPPAGAWHIELLDTSDQPGALGYHEDEAFDANSPGVKKGSSRSSRGLAAATLLPLAKVFVKTSREDGVQATEVASHEMLEMLVDPRVVDESQIRKYLNTEKKEWYIAEVGDPVQGEGYDVGEPEGRPTGVPEATVANFAYPAWWKQPQTRVGYDFRGTRKAPFEISPAGYMSVAPEANPSQWTQINGSATAPSTTI